MVSRWLASLAFQLAVDDGTEGMLTSWQLLVVWHLTELPSTLSSGTQSPRIPGGERWMRESRTNWW